MFRNNQQLIFLGFFLALSLFSWVMGQLREKRKIKRAREEARRRYEEQLRTGRSPEEQPSVLVQQSARAQEMAEQRQAQLRELRRQQEQQTPRQRPLPGVVATTGQRVIVARPPGAPGGVVVQRVPNAPRQPIPQAPKRAPSGPTSITSKQAPGMAKNAGELQEAWDKKREQDRSERERAFRQGHIETVRADKAQEIVDAAGVQAKAVTRAGEVASARAAGVRQRAAFLGEGKARRVMLARSIIVGEIMGKPMSMREE